MSPLPTKTGPTTYAGEFLHQIFSARRVRTQSGSEREQFFAELLAATNANMESEARLFGAKYFLLQAG